eukprot:754430-Hanusia_phi.AAC.1
MQGEEEERRRKGRKREKAGEGREGEWGRSRGDGSLFALPTGGSSLPLPCLSLESCRSCRLTSELPQVG